MDKKTKQYLTVAVTSVTLFAALMNFSAVIGFAKRILGLILPIIAGGILALFFSVPMNGIKKIINKKTYGYILGLHGKNYLISMMILTKKIGV